MEKCKVTELTEQNITDEEKTAAATRTHTQRSRQAVQLEIIKRYLCVSAYRLDFVLCVHRPFLDMVYSALDCTNDDYHALFVLCLLYAVSHSKGQVFDVSKTPMHSYGCLQWLVGGARLMFWGQHLRKGIKNEPSPMFRKIVIHQNILLHRFPLTWSMFSRHPYFALSFLLLPPSVCRCKQGSSRTAAAASS